jgi:hypothetical protein
MNWGKCCVFTQNNTFSHFANEISAVLVFHKLMGSKRLGFTMFHGNVAKRLRLAVNELWIAVDKLLVGRSCEV